MLMTGARRCVRFLFMEVKNLYVEMMYVVFIKFTIFESCEFIVEF